MSEDRRAPARGWLRGRRGRTIRASGLALAAVLLAGSIASDLRAAPPAAAPIGSTAGPHVTVAAQPVFGADAAFSGGWTELVARIENVGSEPVKGVLEVDGSAGSYGLSSSDGHFVAHAPFSVQPHAAAVLHVPVHAHAYVGPSVGVVARAADGTKLAEATVSLTSNSAPLLVDVDDPSRLSIVMRGWPLTLPSSSSGSNPLTVGAPATDPSTGDPMLPDRAAGYGGCTVVVIPSDRLARLQGPELDAIVGWVLGGGTLAVFPTRPEDLRTGILPTLAGGNVTSAAVPPIMLTLPGSVRTGPPPIFGPPTGAPAVPVPTFDAGGATPIGWYVPARTTPFTGSAGIGPGAALRPRLTGYAGGNLRPTEYGATATYGLGQVHVLGFDPTTSPGLEDAWAHGRLLDMIVDAIQRREVVAFPQSAVRSGSTVYEVRRALDPNENFRPALGIAAILLVLYSIVAGPVTFMRSYRRSRPLDPLVWVPVASAGCFALIVLIGLAGKGWSGRSRHLALVEAGAGMSRGVVQRYRGLFASQTRAMRVRASEPGSVLDVVAVDSRDQGDAVLSLDKDGASLENLTSLPWQTVVVGEEGFTDLGAGVAVRQQPDGSVVVANHTGRTLKNVVVWAPSSDARWFASIRNGDTVTSTGGRQVFTALSRTVETVGTHTVHGIAGYEFQRSITGAGEDMAKVWSAMGNAAGNYVDWWPDGVPVVIGEVEGGEGVHTDASLRVESDVLLFRVVGEGGAT